MNFVLFGGVGYLERELHMSETRFPFVVPALRFRKINKQTTKFTQKFSTSLCLSGVRVGAADKIASEQVAEPGRAALFSPPVDAIH
jgi:hypothetical protein